MDTRAINLRLGDAVDRGKGKPIVYVTSLTCDNVKDVGVVFTDGTADLVPRHHTYHVLEYERIAK